MNSLMNGMLVVSRISNEVVLSSITYLRIQSS